MSIPSCTTGSRPGVILFGEMLLRLNAEGFSRLVQAERFQAVISARPAETFKA